LSDCLRNANDGELPSLLGVATTAQLGLIEHDWPGWAHPDQLPPETAWATWLFLGGRGAGKTRAGAEWLSRRATPDARLALIGQTLHDVREVMVDGPSGLRAIAPDARRPVYESSRRLLRWPNGAVAHAFSAEDPEGLRGPQFHAAWADEFCSWRRGGDVLAMARLGLRLGETPQLMVTTTPRPSRALKALMAETTTTASHAGTEANAHNLSRNFLSGLKALYGGSRLEAQEVDGLVLGEENALWTEALLARCRGEAPERCETVVVGLDPCVSGGGDGCGIVVVGRSAGRAFVLEDRSLKASKPEVWARTVARAVAEHEADWVIAETNQGGEMIADVLKAARCGARVKGVFAQKGKRARAEPVSVLYERGRVIHCGRFPKLEHELLALGEGGGPSPDRADALVHALSFLLLNESRGEEPRARYV
jgi:phage terminase large subunit-like protein